MALTRYELNEKLDGVKAAQALRENLDGQDSVGSQHGRPDPERNFDGGELAISVTQGESETLDTPEETWTDRVPADWDLDQIYCWVAYREGVEYPHDPPNISNEEGNIQDDTDGALLTITWEPRRL